jgi:hypothetical protein
MLPANPTAETFSVKRRPGGNYRSMLACRLTGHRPRYRSDGATMHWACARGCGASGSKRYATADDARRYAAALNREDSEAFGRRPLLSMLPLKLLARSRPRR